MVIILTFQLGCSQNTNSQDKEIAISLRLLDQEGNYSAEPLHIAKQSNELIECVFEFATYTTTEAFFDVILLCNYEIMPFSLNGSDKQTIHQIQIPNTDNEILATKWKILFENNNYHENDCFLILKQTNIQYAQGSFDFISSNRFYIVNDRAYNQVEPPVIESHSIQPNGQLGLTSSLLNSKEIGHLSDTDLKHDYVFDIIEPSEVSIPLYFNMSKDVDTKRFPDFNDIGIDSTYEIGVFGISNNQMVHFNNGQTLLSYDAYMKKPNVIFPTLSLSEDDTEMSFFIVNYPFKSQQSINHPHEMVFWSTVMNTQKAKLKRNE